MKKKILLVHHSGYIGGAGVSLFHIAHSLKSLNEKYDFKVYCPTNPPHIYNWLEKNEIETIRANKTPVFFTHYSGCDRFILGRNSLKNIIDIFLFKRSWKELKKVILESKPDVVIVNSMTLFWMGSLIKKMGIKTICFHRETYAKGLFGVRTNIIKESLKKFFDGVAFISDNDLQETGKTLGCSRVITDKVDYSNYKLSDQTNIKMNSILTKDTLKIIYLGGVSKLKGAHVIIKALNRIKNKNVKLIFLQFESEKRCKKLGDCKTAFHKIKLLLGLDYEAYILKLIHKYKLWDRIVFIPAVLEPEKYILAADLVVFPSTEPHQARPLYEAGMAKKPIILTNFKQTSEFVIDGFNSLTFKNGKYKELANRILQLENDQDLYNDLIKNNYHQSISYHNLKTLPSELDAFLSDVLHYS
ncbi:glycosyltransferase family 4 protein [Sutcliffiella horikoshii]|uniref:glycosyltransferase family 4 protein n=1 Tax=Sutcliffiella horikoshii TaxID=79883 RepID=UPI001CFE0210|nr:glycosyltransferase [Sutcliffiella horikoshii]